MQWPNILLVAGTNRNVGKTTFCCRLIEHIAANQQVTAIKVSPHFHDEFEDSRVITQNTNLVIAEELSKSTGKDSSRMLNAGAEKVYFVQAADQALAEAVTQLRNLIPGENAVVCESAALRERIEPGLFVLMSRSGAIDKNRHFIDIADAHIVDYHYVAGDFRFNQRSGWSYGSVS